MIWTQRLPCPDCRHTGHMYDCKCDHRYCLCRKRRLARESSDT